MTYFIKFNNDRFTRLRLFINTFRNVSYPT